MSNFLNRSDAERILQSSKCKQNSPFTTCGLGHIEKVFDQSVQLGPIAIYVSKSRIPESCLKQIQANLQNASQEKFEVSFESTDDSEVEIFDLNSLPKGAKLPPEIQKLLDDRVVDDLQRLKSSDDRK